MTQEDIYYFVLSLINLDMMTIHSKIENKLEEIDNLGLTKELDLRELIIIKNHIEEQFMILKMQSTVH